MTVRVEVELRGVERYERALAALDPRRGHGRDAVRRGLLRAAQLVQSIAAGEMIVRGRGNKAPALPDRLSGRTGALAGSIAVDQRAPDRVAIGTALVYGGVHERGGPVARRTGVVFYPRRPFLQPAAERAGRQIERILAREWERVSTRGGGPR